MQNKNIKIALLTILLAAAGIGAGVGTFYAAAWLAAAMLLEAAG